MPPQVTREGEGWRFVFDEAEARGTIVIEPCGYGLWVTFPEVDGEPALLLDLYYQSAARCDADQPAAPGVAIHSPQTTPDMVAYARFCPAPRGTRVEFETGVQLCRTPTGEPDWGYPAG
ncbi:MAG: hypothetical protein KKA73_28770 [Chloroflexi bacterium]|nr:hypothetical protein [Chloroflexota bacterium]MBU1751687.1 hypothetical protein [Chloroflexota bacterium]MBU1878022.1 hypothetical protein [Chloroflexota bacterium]